MTVRRPLVVVAGQVQELASGDSVPDLDLKADLTGAAFRGEVSVATSGTPSSLSITKNTNPTLTPLGDDGNLATLTGKNGKAARFIFDAYGGNVNAMYRRANGTALAPTGLLASEYIGNISFFGHDGVTHLTAANANIVGYATETWTPTARGCAIRFKTTANGVGGSAVDRYDLTHTGFSGYTDNSVTLGSATYRWLESHVTNSYVYGNLNLEGFSRKILGNFSDVAQSNRTVFQSNVTDGASVVGVIPNGTSRVSAIKVSNGSDIVNASHCDVIVTDVNCRIESNALGTGAFLPLEFHTGTFSRMHIANLGHIGINCVPSGSYSFEVNGSGSFTSSLDVASTLTMGAGMVSGKGVSTDDVVYEMGLLRTGDGNCYIDMHATPGTDFDARILRLAGANGSFQIANTGTGNFDISQNGAGDITIYTSATSRMVIKAGGNVLVGSNTDNTVDKLQVAGSVSVTGIKVTGGTPGVGKVLTSDNDGVGTWQTPTGGAGVTWKSTTLDLGTVPIYSKSVTFADAAATTTSKINIVHAPTNDEAEMDAVIAAAVCLTNSTITVYVHAIPGPVTGSKNFNYFLG